MGTGRLTTAVAALVAVSVASPWTRVDRTRCGGVFGFQEQQLPSHTGFRAHPKPRVGFPGQTLFATDKLVIHSEGNALLDDGSQLSESVGQTDQERLRRMSMLIESAVAGPLVTLTQTGAMAPNGRYALTGALLLAEDCPVCVGRSSSPAHEILLWLLAIEREALRGASG